MSEEPGDARFVIVGGGAVGCGVAYALVRAGQSDVLVVEAADELGRVTTSQGAGLCGQVRETVERTRLAMHSVRTFRELQSNAQATVRPEWHEVGSLRIAITRDAAGRLKDLAAVAAEAGLETELLDGRAVASRWPLLQADAITAALWCPSDGYMIPASVVGSYADYCRRQGARFATGTSVHGVRMVNGRVAAIETSRGTVDCQYVINAAGAHAYHIAQLVGLELPIVPVRHEYFVTRPMPGTRPDWPCLRIPELALYGRIAEGGLLLGGWERTAMFVDPRSYQLGGHPPPLEADWGVLDAFRERFAPLMPQIRDAASAREGKGWPTFTPDGHFIVGPARGVPGFVMAGGCNAHGISGSAGLGQLVTESILEDRPSPYVRSLSPDRFTNGEWNWPTAIDQARGIYETYYDVPTC